MQMNTPFIYKSSPICCSHKLQVRYEFTMMNSVDVASLVGDWRNAWEPKIIDELVIRKKAARLYKAN